MYANACERGYLRFCVAPRTFLWWPAARTLALVAGTWCRRRRSSDAVLTKVGFQHIVSDLRDLLVAGCQSMGRSRGLEGSEGGTLLPDARRPRLLI
eukprot:6198838-Pleurochrysis_carterae.AAC.2